MAIIQIEIRQRVAVLTLNNAPVNSLSEAALDELLVALKAVSEDTQVGAVVIASANPKIFCSGLDLSAIRQSDGVEMRRVLDKLYPQLCEQQFAMDKPVIAAITGSARGGGMTLAISCDMLIAGQSATFGYPEIDRALLPAIHFTHLHRLIGRYRAFDLLFTGRTFSAQEAQQLGLVSQVHADHEVLAKALALAEQLGAKSPTTMRVARQAFMRGFDSVDSYRSGVHGAVDLFCDHAQSADAAEGLAAFLEKRPPRWASD